MQSLATQERCAVLAYCLTYQSPRTCAADLNSVPQRQQPMWADLAGLIGYDQVRSRTIFPLWNEGDRRLQLASVLAVFKCATLARTSTSPYQRTFESLV